MKNKILLFLLLAVFISTPVYAQRHSGVTPSLRQGYARSAGESKYPQLWRGLVGAWVPALGVTGNTLFDVGAFKNHGTLTNMDAGTDWVVGENGYALDFDGVDDYVIVPSSNSFDTTGEITILAFIKLNGSINSNCSIVTKGDTAGVQPSHFFSYYGAENKLAFYANVVDAFVFSDVISIEDSQGHCVAVTGSEGYPINFYLEGSLINSTSTYSKGDNSSAHPLYIGSRFHTPEGIFEVFDGTIGYTFIYNRILTPNERAWLHRNPLAMFELRED